MAINSVQRIRSGAGRLLGRPDRRFADSTSYWKARYQVGDNSGAGSYGPLARFKAEVVNRFVLERRCASVLELGCGDGNQLTLAHYPSYVGVDVAPAAIERCRAKFAGDTTKRFIVAGEEDLPICDLGLSLDVIYHLVEDEVFDAYMAELLGHSTRVVILYTSDSDDFVPLRSEPEHVRHRPVQDWMERRLDWKLVERIPNPHPWREDRQHETSFANFYIYEHRG